MKKAIFLSIFLSGLCSLGYQSIWQRYLGILVGSESRSITLIISVFLFGLSLGYFYFGKLSTKLTSRNQSAKLYGYIEVATAMYALLFNKFFSVVLESGIANSNNLFLHFLITCLLILLPTFLMGATIPIMTLALPESEKDINSTHSKIYGINTIGAFSGVLITSLFLVPSLGLEISLKLLGAINLALSIVYLLNNLEGKIADKKEIERLPININSKLLMLFVFIIGMASISLEVVWIRVLSLSLGTSYIVFPIILSIFIFSIGYGSLRLKHVNANSFYMKLVYMIAFSCLSFVTIPYLPLIISNIRVMFISHPVTFYFFHIVVYLLLFILIAPAVFFIGQMLPYAYAFLDKNKEDYALKCGQMYFANTVGTIVGAVFFGYLFFVLFELKTIYLLILWTIGIVSLYFLKEIKDTKKFLTVITLLVITTLLPFSRKHHIIGQFRKRSVEAIHFKNPIKVVNSQYPNVETLFLDDGPNTTVSVMKKILDRSKSFFVNAKSDGNTKDDLGTMSLASVLPYSKMPAKKLETAVIGIGTGISAGVLTKIENVVKVDVVEISKAAIKSVGALSPENFDFHKSKKTRIFEMDAFQFFKASSQKYDIVISEPSNVWVTGVENLYTNYYYKTVAEKLKNNGVFSQWFHYYSMNSEIFVTILNNLKSVFKKVELYRTTEGDIVALAANNNFMTSEFRSNTAKEILQKINLKSHEDLKKLMVFNDKEISFIIKDKPSFLHDIFDPHIGHRAYKSFFLGESVELAPLLDPYFARLLQSDEDILDFKDIQNIECIKDPVEKVYDIGCSIIKNRVNVFLSLFNSQDILNKLKGYSILRKEKYLRKDLGLLRRISSKLLNSRLTKPQEFRAGVSLVNEFQKEGAYSEAIDLVKSLVEKKIFTAQHLIQFTHYIEMRKKKSLEVIGKY